MRTKCYEVILEVLGNKPQLIGSFLTEQRAQKFKNYFISNVDGYGEKYNMYIREE